MDEPEEMARLASVEPWDTEKKSAIKRDLTKVLCFLALCRLTLILIGPHSVFNPMVY